MSATKCNAEYPESSVQSERNSLQLLIMHSVMHSACLCSLPIPGALQLDSRILLLLEQQHALEDPINLNLQHAVALVDLTLHLPTHSHDLLQRSTVCVDHDAVCVAIYDLHTIRLPAHSGGQLDTVGARACAPYESCVIPLCVGSRV